MAAPDPPVAFDPDDLVRHTRFVKSLARELARDEAEADDLAARTLAEAVARRPGSGPGIRVWLRRVLWRIFRRERRDEERRARNTLKSATEIAQGRAAAAPATVDLVARIELEQAIAAAFAELDEPLKSALFLRFYDDRTPSQIAAQTGTPVETVKTRLKRGLAKLRARLDARARARVAPHGDWRAVALALAKQGGTGVVVVKTKSLVAAAVVVVLVGATAWRLTSRARARATDAAANPDSVAAASSNDEPIGSPPTTAPSDGEHDADSPSATRTEETTPPFATGIVVDEDGRPISGARVVASVIDRRFARFVQLVSSSGLDSNSLDRRTVARTGSDGRFAVTHVPEDLVGFYFVADGFTFGSWFDLSAVAAENRDHQVELARGGTLRGRVHDQEGRPVFGAGVGADEYDHAWEKLTARNLEGAPEYFHSIPAFASARCNAADGTFELTGLPRTSCRITVAATGYVELVQNHEPDERDWDVRLWRNHPIVDVSDARTGSPIASVRAFIGRSDETEYRRLLTTTDFLEQTQRGIIRRLTPASGRILLPAVAALSDPDRGSCSTARVLVFADGYRSKTLEVALDSGGEPPHLAVALDAGATEESISGTITGTGTGAGTDPAHVELRWTGATGPLPNVMYPDRDPGVSEPPLLALDVGSTGRFTFRGLPPERYRIDVTARDRGPRCLVVDAPAHDVKIELVASATLEVAVVDARGAPQPGVTVHLQSSDDQHVRCRGTNAKGLAISGGLSEGSFRIVAAANVDHAVVIGDQRLDASEFDPDDTVTLSAGEHRRVSLKIVEPVDVTFHVHAAGDAAIEGASINVTMSECHAPEALTRELRRTLHALVLETDCDGDAHLQLFPSTCVLDVRADGHHFHPTVRIPREASARIDLPVRDE